MSVWFITGTSRGIGLETVRQLAADKKNKIIASCRSPASATALAAVQGDVHVVPLDITSDESVQTAFAKTVALLGPGKGIDYLVNNAGIANMDDAEGVTPDELRRQFDTNVIGTLRVYRAFLPFVRQAVGGKKVVVNVSTGLASIASDHGAKFASYCIAKAAQNMLTYKLTKQHPDVTTIAFDPGWIKTDLGTDEAPLELVPTVTQHIKVYESIDESRAGKFIDYEGNEVPW